ncbi:DUF885 domain-containing protein [Roseateles toxinivorans]|uniref:Uncharacterized protein (DUF885 family) n=1 Tax=Roseateles toxinivorans TaxID=270368 RepID=A0A4R6QL49_9BURK|nr:DUF885 domain-containing protein [Roseateles toxinivorans]TDP63392.1 uncharacterized protein (DUF885 family) [Roseateles toxinivorans]
MKPHQLMSALGLCVAGLMSAGASMGAGPTSGRPHHLAQGDAATQRLHRLFAEAWEQGARRAPEWATFRGDHRFNDRLSDRSPEGIAAAEAAQRDMLKRVKAIPRERLAERDQVSYDLFVHRIEEDLALNRFEGYRSLSLGALWGFQSGLSGLMRQSPSTTEKDLRNILARYAAFPTRVDQEIARLRLGMGQGWVTSRPVLERALAQLDGQLLAEVMRSPMAEPFGRIGADVPAATAQALRDEAAKALQQQVYPAMQKLGRFLREEYLPKAPEDGAFARYPDGKAVYAALVKQNTTTPLTPEQVHQLGLQQVERLRREMEAIKTELGFGGTLAQFIDQLNQDPKQYYADGEALLAGYREIAKRIDPELPRLFAELPRAPYGVRAMPDYMGPGAAENYNGPGDDGRTPGWFNANALAFKNRPKYSLATLVAHETVPGHHLQTARARELGDLPEFRRGGFYTVFSEGWALYAETLGTELGLYRDPYSRFGHVQAQMLRATRLVVDTGIHALGWQRQQAIDYMVELTGQRAVFISAEVDRYYSMPGQALAYMVGQLKFTELRARAAKALGERFDVRKFHMVLLDQGAIPLDVLEQRVNGWIAAQLKLPKT